MKKGTTCGVKEGGSGGLSLSVRDREISTRVDANLADVFCILPLNYLHWLAKSVCPQ